MQSDQFMEDRSEYNFEQVPNQKPLLVQEIYAPIEQASNLLWTSTKLVQSIQPKFVELVQSKPIYIFLETSTGYV